MLISQPKNHCIEIHGYLDVGHTYLINNVHIFNRNPYLYFILHNFHFVS